MTPNVPLPPNDYFVEEVKQQLLANTVIENFRVERLGA